MFTDMLTALITSYKISMSPKDFTRFKMDEEERMQKYWSEYLEKEFQPEDFFIDPPEELMEKQRAFANPICSNCSRETYSLLKEENNNILSMCPCCRRTYKTHI